MLLVTVPHTRNETGKTLFFFSRSFPTMSEARSRGVELDLDVFSVRPIEPPGLLLHHDTSRLLPVPAFVSRRCRSLERRLGYHMSFPS